MPYIGPESGDIAHGVGGGFASLDNVAFSRGGVGGWVDRDRIAFANGADAWMVSSYDKATGYVARVVFDGVTTVANTIYAGGGHVAVWVDTTTGVYATTGMRAPKAGLLGMGPDASIAYKPDYFALGPTIVREVTGEEWQLTPAAPLSLQLLGARRAIWMEGSVIKVANLPPAAYVNAGGVWAAQAAYAAGAWWVCYYSGEKGIVLHPFASAARAYSILPKGDGWFAISVVSAGDTIRIAVSRTQGEGPGDIWGYDINVTDGRATPLPCWPEGRPTTFLFLPMASINPAPKPPDPVPPDPTPPDPEPPHPKPPDPPTPHPVPVFGLAIAKEVPMEMRVALRLGQMFASVDATAKLRPDGYRYDIHGPGPFPGWYPVRFLSGSRATDPACAFTLSQPHAPDVRLLLRHDGVPVSALSADATEFSGDIASEFGLKPSVPVSDWGGYEAWNGWTLQGQGIDLVLVQYDRDGQKYTSACLTVVAL